MCALIPTFVPREPQWRGSTSSADMNSNFSEILYDLNSLFSEVSSLVVDINSLESRVRHELDATNDRLYAVSGLISSYAASASGYKMFHEDFFLENYVTYPASLSAEDRCVVEPQYGVATLPANNTFSKVYSYNISDGKIHVAPDLVVTVTPTDETGFVGIEETDPLLAFDGEDETVWERKPQFNRDYAKSAVTTIATVTMPSMSNPYVNRLGVKPHPEGTVDIQMVTYDTTVAQDIILPTFPAINGLNNMSPTLFSFDNIQPINFKFYLRQRNSSLEDDYKTFIYGLKNVAIEEAEYKTSGRVGIKFDLPDYETTNLRYITSVRTSPNYDNIMYKVRLYMSQVEFDADIPVWTSDRAPITSTNKLDVSLYASSSVWIVVELNQATGGSGSPLLDSVTLTYTTI